MSKNPDVLFQPVKHPYQFSALGYLRGSFQVTPEEEIKTLIAGTILTPEGVQLNAFIKNRDWEKLNRREDFAPESELYWRVYFRTTKEGILTKVNLIRPISNPPLQVEASSEETLKEVADIFQVRGRIYKIFKAAFSVQLERNEKPPKGRENSYLWKPFYVTIQGNLPDGASPEQFWELLCTREGEYLRLERATLMREEMGMNASQESSNSPASRSTHNRTKPATNSQSPQESQIIMIDGRQPEMTVKFTERPDVPAQGKKVTLQITGENGIVVQAELNRKTLAKQVEKMDNFQAWVGALSGKVAAISPQGVVTLEAAGVQVFERQDKTKTAETKEESAA